MCLFIVGFLASATAGKLPPPPNVKWVLDSISKYCHFLSEHKKFEEKTLIPKCLKCVFENTVCVWSGNVQVWANRRLQLLHLPRLPVLLTCQVLHLLHIFHTPFCLPNVPSWPSCDFVEECPDCICGPNSPSFSECPRDIPTDPLLENEHKVNILRGILRPNST